MPIKFKHEAAAVVIPTNASNRKYGQQLVLNQQKYANDQREMLFRQQQQGVENQFRYLAGRQHVADIAQRDAVNELRDSKRLAEQRAYAATQLTDQRTYSEKIAAEQLARQQAAQLKAQARADDFAGVKSGAYKGKIASDIEAAHALTTQIDLQGQRGEMDAAQVAEAHAKNQANLNELRKGRISVPSMTEQYNEGVKWKDPSTGMLHDPDLGKYPNGKPDGWDTVDLNTGGSSKSQKQQQQQLPSSYDEYIGMDIPKANKELEAKMEALRTKAEDDGKPYADDQELEDAAYAELKGRYERQYARSFGVKPAVPGQAQVPPQASQPAIPPAESVGMQGLEPTYNPDGTTSAPMAGVGTPLPAAQDGQVADPAANEAAWQESMQAKFNEAPGQAMVTAPVLAPNEPSPGETLQFVDKSGQKVERTKKLIDGSIYQRASNYVYNPDGSASIPPGTKSEYGEWKQVWLDASGNEVQPPQVGSDNVGQAASAQSNAWSELAAAEQQAPEASQAVETPPADATSPATAIPVPDFGMLMSKAADDKDRAVLGKIQSIYNSQAPEIQNAISVLVNPDTSPQEIARILDYLKASGVDLNKLPQPGTGTERLKKYQNNSTTTMR